MNHEIISERSIALTCTAQEAATLWTALVAFTGATKEQDSADFVGDYSIIKAWHAELTKAIDNYLKHHPLQHGLAPDARDAGTLTIGELRALLSGAKTARCFGQDGDPGADG